MLNFSLSLPAKPCQTLLSSSCLGFPLSQNELSINGYYLKKESHSEILITSGEDLESVIQVCRMHCGNIDLNDLAGPKNLPSFIQEDDSQTQYKCKSTGQTSPLGNLALFSTQSLFKERLDQFNTFLNSKQEFASDVVYTLKTEKTALYHSYQECMQIHDSEIFIPTSMKQVCLFCCCLGTFTIITKCQQIHKFVSYRSKKLHNLQ